MTRYSAHVSMLFTEHPPLERPAAAAAAGFSLIESWWPPADDLDAWADAVDAAGVGVSCLNADGGDIAAGERGFCNLAERDADTFAAVEAALAMAIRVGAPNVNVLPGLVAPGRSVDRQLDHAATVYRHLGDLAAPHGIAVVIEPINPVDVPAYLTPTPSAVADLIARVDHPSVRMLLDAYHCARAGLDPNAEATRYGPLVAHVQYADCPGRGAPGTGNVSLDTFLGTLRSVGYRGAVGLEYAPGGPTVDSLAWFTSEDRAEG